VALVALAAGSGGCRMDATVPLSAILAPATSPPPASSVTPDASPDPGSGDKGAPASDPGEAAGTPADPPIDRAAAARAFRAAWCIMKRQDRTGLRAAYRREGFEDSAALAAAWARLREEDPAFVERTMAEVVSMTCPAPQ